MRHILLSVLIIPTFLSAQVAPDFTVTDIYGESHALYSGYLNQGKTVMLKIFYSTCPPCNAQATALQALYVEWGSGDHDVEFIEVSNKTWETNQTASNYVNAHSISFPTVSAQGGSIAVYDAYRNGGFGTFYGTPTYVVISPQGNVQWDVSFSSLDAAIANTGAEKPLSSGVNDAVRLRDYWIAPNPSVDFMDVYTAQASAGLSLHVYSILGKRLYSYKPQGSTGELLHREDVSGWLPGTYLVRVERNGTVLKTMRFVRR